MDVYRTPEPSPCPRCNAGLFSGKIGHLAALACGQCGGLWLDNDGSAAVVRGCDLDASELARRVDANALRTLSVLPYQAAKGGCPVCRAPLGSATLRDVTVDYCDAHGTFFDRGELARLLVEHVGRMPIATAHAATPSMQEIRTEVRHELAYQRDPVTTALADWIHGGPDWVNRTWLR